MFSRNWIAVTAVFAIAWLAPSAWGQAAEEEVPKGGAKEIETAFGGKIDNVKLLSELSSIRDNTLTDDKRRVLEIAAKFYVYRVTWSQYVKSPDDMDQAINEFHRFYAKFCRDRPSPIKDKTESETVKYLNQQLAVSFKEVFKRDFMKNRLTAVNAAQLLPGLALYSVSGPSLKGEQKSEEISNLLVELIQKQHHAIKVYAIRALKSYFPLDANSKDPMADKKRIEALTEYIEQDWASMGKADDELAAVSYLRREAIQTLAQAQLPILKLPKKAGVKNEGQVAVTLLKVLAKNALKPPPPPKGHNLWFKGLAERCQASFGLCEFKEDPTLTYQADVAVYAVGHCLSEFFEAYRDDKASNVKPGLPEFFDNGERKIPQLPWQSLAERWKRGLSELRTANAKNNKLYGQVNDIKKEADRMIDSIIAYKEIPDGDFGSFHRFMTGETVQPATRSLFKGNKDAEVNLGY